MYLYLPKPITDGKVIKVNMKRCGFMVLALTLWLVIPCKAQQVIYANLHELVAQEGDTVTTLRVEKRSKNKILLLSGGDYRIEAKDNSSLSRYLRKRCYAVRVDSALYVNCRKMRYKRYRFGSYFAPAFQIGEHVYFCAQPVGQAASSTSTRPGAPRLGGDVGNAIAASALINARVFYEINPRNGRAEFVSKEKMMSLLGDYPHLQERLQRETSEGASVMGYYLMELKRLVEEK